MRIYLLTILLLASVLAVACLTGCGSMPKINTTGKAVLVDGYNAISLIDTGYNPVTGTVTPSMTHVISSGTYSGVPVNKSAKDYFYYSSKSDSSVWNAECKNAQQLMIFSTSDKELMSKAILAMASSLIAG
jgi:hypothetical protein